jgi:hypothetical protein
MYDLVMCFQVRHIMPAIQHRLAAETGSVELVKDIDHWERSANFDLSDCAGATMPSVAGEFDRIARHCARMRKGSMRWQEM